jgi:hypothetical protein
MPNLLLLLRLPPLVNVILEFFDDAKDHAQQALQDDP